jgi:hypothetical protein
MRKNTSALLAIVVLALGWTAATAATGDSLELQTNRIYIRESILAERDFPFLSALRIDPEARSVLANEPELARVTSDRWAAIAKANRSCGDSLPCRCAAVKTTPSEVAVISTQLRQAFQANVSLQQFVQKQLNGNAEFSLRTSQGGADLLVENWERSITALNQIVATYCEGSKPRYGEIDSMTYQAGSRTYASLIRIVLDGLPIEENFSPNSQNRAETLFFEPELRFALRLLQANSRDESGRFWPLDHGENRAVVRHIQTMSWSKYPYSVIVVPGAGSEIAAVSLSPWGKERLRLAVQAYRSGLAPFIMVSGGFVHPSQTPFCEALEMKHYLMEVYGIAEANILLEPYARHTTTNLRNAVREIFDYGIPAAKSMLIVSDAAQSSYIESETFHKRNEEELGYQPVTLGKRISASQLEAFPSRQSLFSDPLDPLDP